MRLQPPIKDQDPERKFYNRKIKNTCPERKYSMINDCRDRIQECASLQLCQTPDHQPLPMSRSSSQLSCHSVHFLPNNILELRVHQGVGFPAHTNQTHSCTFGQTMRQHPLDRSEALLVAVARDSIEHLNGSANAVIKQTLVTPVGVPNAYA